MKVREVNKDRELGKVRKKKKIGATPWREQINRQTDREKEGIGIRALAIYRDRESEKEISKRERVRR